MARVTLSRFGKEFSTHLLRCQSGSRHPFLGAKWETTGGLLELESGLERSN